MIQVSSQYNRARVFCAFPPTWQDSIKKSWS